MIAGESSVFSHRCANGNARCDPSCDRCTLLQKSFNRLRKSHMKKRSFLRIESAPDPHAHRASRHRVHGCSCRAGRRLGAPSPPMRASPTARSILAPASAPARDAVDQAPTSPSPTMCRGKPSAHTAPLAKETDAAQRRRGIRLSLESQQPAPGRCARTGRPVSPFSLCPLSFPVATIAPAGRSPARPQRAARR